MRRDKILIFQDTMESIEQGFYVKNGEKISLKTSKDERMKVQVLLPDEIEAIERKEAKNNTRVECIYMDSFTAARREYQKWEEEGKQGNEPHILVLNFANAFTPGGGVRTGATAQEEDLCRKSTLLLSLESDDAAQYYLYNEHHCTNMGSDAMIITPFVEILKDEKGHYLDEPVVISVITCAAPNISGGLCGLSSGEYKAMLKKRINSILKVAASYGYDRLILGAFGCGVFGNKADLVADMFYDAMKANGPFTSVVYAVLDRKDDKKKTNFTAFSNRFGTVAKTFKRNDIIGFHRPEEPYGCFSNWAEAHFKYAGMTYCSTEQFMMAMKVVLGGRWDLFNKIRESSSPEEAQEYAGPKYFTEYASIKNKWEKNRMYIVKQGVKAKFRQNPEMLALLFSTGDALLCECSKTDTTWGIGINLQSSDWKDVNKWKGSNLLGRILMEVREELRMELKLTGDISYVDYSYAESIPEWEMSGGQLRMFPQYYHAVHWYAEVLGDKYKKNLYHGSLESLDECMRNNMGGGLPAWGFYEMKQEIYETANFLRKIK